jgi:beta-glucosidase
VTTSATTCRLQSAHLEPLAEAQRQAAALVKRMTVDEEVSLMVGVGYGAPSGTVGATAPVPGLGVPALDQEDGPAGVADGMTGVTQLPAPEALAATFDTTAARCYGQVIGDEEAAKGAELVYGPTINIVRAPQWGRAFESLGEDPVLTGTIAAAEVQGIQGTGTMAEVKHYAVYNQETYRNTPADDAVVGQKALHEIYLRAWGQVVGSGAAAVMCSYSTVNGVPACEDRALVRGYLEGALGFTGFVGSDYGATGATVASAEAGVDQEQPSASYFGPALALAVRSGLVPKALVDQAATRVLTEMFRFGLIGEPPRGNPAAVATTPADAEVSTEVATEAMTLLKDDGGLLPLSSHGGPVAVIGPAAQADPTTSGGGSATVTSPSNVTPLEALRAALGGGRRVSYTQGVPLSSQLEPVPAEYLAPPFLGISTTGYSATLTAPQTGTYVLGFSEPDDYSPVSLSLDGRGLHANYLALQPLAVDPGTPPVPLYTATVALVAGRRYLIYLNGPASNLVWATPSQVDRDIAGAVAAARRATVAVVVVADDQESEAADRASLALPAAQDELVSAVAKANPRTVVVIEAGGPVTMPWLGEVPAVLDAWYPGQGGAAALAAVLLGRASPSGHLPMTFPASLSKTPVAGRARFPGNGTKVEYSEGVDVGYRWYDQTGTAPLFPFGYGLSYTTFSFSHPFVAIAWAGGRPVVHASVEVANTGRRPGAEVVQAYLGEPAAAGEPPRQLEAFVRAQLAPGQATTARFALRGVQLGYYSAAKGSWELAPGRYQLWMGGSSALAQLPAHVSFSLSSGVALGPAGGS